MTRHIGGATLLDPSLVIRTAIAQQAETEPADVYTKQAEALTSDPAALTAALKVLLTERLKASYTERIAIAERANELDGLIRSDEATLQALEGTAATAQASRTPVMMDKAVAVIQGLQGAATSNPAVAQAFDILDKTCGGLFKQLLEATPKAE